MKFVDPACMNRCKWVSMRSTNIQIRARRSKYDRPYVSINASCEGWREHIYQLCAWFPSRLRRFNGTIKEMARCRLSKQQERHLMKLKTIALATALTLTSTFALAQSPGLGGYGSVTAPSVGSYTAPVGATNAVPTWRNTGPAAPRPTVGNAFGNTRASMGFRSGSTLAHRGLRSGLHR
jgi:hypothetical protein